MAKKRMNLKGDTKENFEKNRGRYNGKTGLLPHVPTKLKIMAFVKSCKLSPLLTLFSLGCFMGLRIGSAIKLKWTDVDLNIGKMMIRDDKNVKRFKSQYGKDRCLDIPSFYIPVLKLWKNINRGEEYVLPRGNSQKSFKSWVTYFEHQYEDLYIQLGMREKWVQMKNGGWRYKYNAHSGRHICATNLLLKGAKIQYVQEFLGHASMDETLRYTHIVNQARRQDIEDAYYGRLQQPRPIVQYIIQPGAVIPNVVPEQEF